MAKDSISTEVQRGRHGLRERLQTWPTDEIDVAKQPVQPASTHAGIDRPAAKARGKQLLTVDATELNLRNPRHFGLSAA